MHLGEVIGGRSVPAGVLGGKGSGTGVWEMLLGVGATRVFIEGSEEAWKRAGVPSVMLCNTALPRSHDRDSLLPREGGVCEPGF